MVPNDSKKVKVNFPALPLFDTLEHIQDNDKRINISNNKYRKDYHKTLSFLKSYVDSEGTFISYRREVERLLHWSWLKANKSIKDLCRDDIEAFIKFCQKPPKSWIGTKILPRFIEQDGLRVANSKWRPFVVTLSKSERKKGKKPKIEQFCLSQGAIQEIFAILSTFYNYLLVEEYALTNPVALIRQKSKFIRKTQDKSKIRRLSERQWNSVMKVTEDLAKKDPDKHERTLFIIAALYLMYLRISELVASPRWTPRMNDFSEDSEGNWCFQTVGKGNKHRQIAVSDEMLKALIRWREHFNLSPLPCPADNSPLIPKLIGKGPVSDPAPIRRLVQKCFDLASEQLRAKGFNQDADNLGEATVQWLRHTGISDDVKHRLREHVRDDAGHSSSAITDKYIDIALRERHASAKNKTLKQKKVSLHKEVIEITS